MDITIGCDHAGFDLKLFLVHYFKDKGIKINDAGCYSKESADYADFGHAVAISVIEGSGTVGILICGSGNGISMAANKHKGIRAALCWIPEIAVLARKHNDANVLVLPGRFITHEDAVTCVEAFLTEQFEGGRHLLRVNKIEL